MSNIIFADVLRDWATNYLAEAKPDEAETLAAVLVLLSNRISEFPLGDKASNLENAIAAYKAALEVYTREALPQQWAMTQNNLGTAYSDRIQGDRADNLENAIAAYKAALEVLTREALPQDWAMTQNNLGNAYRNRIQGDRASNLENAIAAYKAALEVYTREALPQVHAETLFNLGILYQAEKQYALAYNTFESAIETVESLRGEIVSGEESKRKQAEEWNKLYRRMVEVCLALKEDTQAIEFIERSKTRNLVELLFNDDCYPKGEIPAEVKNQLQQLQQKIEVEKRRLEEAEKNQNLEINRSELHQLRQQREQLMSRVIGFNPIRFSEMQNLLDDKTAIIEWYIFGDCFRAFIITSEQDKPEIWHSQPEDLEKLENWIDGYLQLYYQNKDQWRYHLYNQLTQLTKILHLDKILALVPSKCQKIILVPHRYLHLLPLHALQLASGEYLIDKYPGGVSYAPSCQLLRFAKDKFTPPRLRHPSPQAGRGWGWGSADNQADNIFSDLFAIQNPTADLEFTDIEVETIANTFHSPQILKHSTATKAALAQQPNADKFRNASWLHFSCHGYFNFNSPLAFKGRVFKISKIVEKILKCFTWFGCFRIFKSAEMVKKLPNTKSLPLKAVPRCP
jgi:CHAT domain-containing protein